MKTIEEKAKVLVDKFVEAGLDCPASMHRKMEKLIVLFAKEQDRDTRHACAEEIQSDNSGWLVFESQQKLDDHLESLRLTDAISKKCRYQRDLMGISLENLRKINELLGVE